MQRIINQLINLLIKKNTTMPGQAGGRADESSEQGRQALLAKGRRLRRRRS
jgi:hypothetical protein